MKRIKLMPDYQCFSLWWEAPCEPGNIDPKILPLKAETISRLDTWAESYDKTLNLDDPLASGFATQEDESEFEEEGLALWIQLRKELSQKYEVYYYSWLRHELYKTPEDYGDFVK